MISRRVYIFFVLFIIFKKSLYDILQLAISRVVIKITMLEGNNMGSCELCVIMFVQNHSLRCISNYVHSRSIYCAGVGNSPYVLHPVSQTVPDVALVIVIRCSIDIRNLNVDS